MKVVLNTLKIYLLTISLLFPAHIFATTGGGVFVPDPTWTLPTYGTGVGQRCDPYAITPNCSSGLTCMEVEDDSQYNTQCKFREACQSGDKSPRHVCADNCMATQTDVTYNDCWNSCSAHDPLCTYQKACTKVMMELNAEDPPSQVFYREGETPQTCSPDVGFSRGSHECASSDCRPIQMNDPNFPNGRYCMPIGKCLPACKVLGQTVSGPHEACCFGLTVGPDDKCVSDDYVGEVPTFIDVTVGEGTCVPKFSEVQGEFSPARHKEVMDNFRKYYRTLLAVEYHFAHGTKVLNDLFGVNNQAHNAGVTLQAERKEAQKLFYAKQREYRLAVSDLLNQPGVADGLNYMDYTNMNLAQVGNSSSAIQFYEMMALDSLAYAEKDGAMAEAYGHFDSNMIILNGKITAGSYGHPSKIFECSFDKCWFNESNCGKYRWRDKYCLKMCWEKPGYKVVDPLYPEADLMSLTEGRGGGGLRTQEILLALVVPFGLFFLNKFEKPKFDTGTFTSAQNENLELDLIDAFTNYATEPLPPSEEEISEDDVLVDSMIPEINIPISLSPEEARLHPHQQDHPDEVMPMEDRIRFAREDVGAKVHYSIDAFGKADSCMYAGPSTKGTYATVVGDKAKYVARFFMASARARGMMASCLARVAEELKREMGPGVAAGIGVKTPINSTINSTTPGLNVDTNLRGPCPGGDTSCLLRRAFQGTIARFGGTTGTLNAPTMDTNTTDTGVSLMNTAGGGPLGGGVAGQGAAKEATKLKDERQRLHDYLEKKFGNTEKWKQSKAAYEQMSKGFDSAGYASSPKKKYKHTTKDMLASNAPVSGPVDPNSKKLKKGKGAGAEGNGTSTTASKDAGEKKKLLSFSFDNSTGGGTDGTALDPSGKTKGDADSKALDNQEKAAILEAIEAKKGSLASQESDEIFTKITKAYMRSAYPIFLEFEVKDPNGNSGKKK